MDIFTGPVIAFIILASFSLLSTTPASSHQCTTTCSESFTKMKEAKNISQCMKLPTLGAEFGWTHHPDHDHQSDRIDIFFGTRLHAELGWLAWGVNPTNMPKMVGTRAIIGIRLANGSLAIDTYNVTVGTKLGCGLLPSEIGVSVQNKKIDYSELNQYFTISATLYLPRSEYNISRLNHVWQVGYQTIGMMPLMHPTTLQNFDSVETINLRTAESKSVEQHRHHLRMVHGVLNIMGWGIFLPIGAMATRYFRVHPMPSKWWFYLHVGFQTSGYILGTAGWIVGLWLGHASTYYSFHKHRILSIFIFTFTSLQMLALRLKPSRKDEYRKFWNLYHHSLGYALLAAISVNIFLGISILRPADGPWKWSYVGILAIFGVVFLAFEIYSWSKFLREKKNVDKKNPGLTQPK